MNEQRRPLTGAERNLIVNAANKAFIEKFLSGMTAGDEEQRERANKSQEAFYACVNALTTFSLESTEEVI